ncbi:MAG: hypothetical protein IJL80_04015 [Treponema sp.]|nr:hypothetical protein [Treponema sp.]
MRKGTFAAIIFMMCTFGHAQTAFVFGVDAQSFLRDEKNIIRYNPLNIFDNNPDTVFAVNKKSFDSSEPLVQIFLGNSISIDEIRIKAGYFDKRYFKANYRIKSGAIALFDGKGELARKEFLFADAMSAQSVMFGPSSEVCKIQIYVSELYDCEKWDDIVISDISFCFHGSEYRCDYGAYGNAYASYKERNEYDGKGLLIRQSKDYPPFWGYNYRNAYDSGGRLVFSWRDGGDGPGDTYVLYEYPGMEARYPCEIQKFEKTGDGTWKEYGIICNPYKLDSLGRVTESDDFDGSATNLYKGNALSKKVETEKASGEKHTYYYQEGRCVLEEQAKNWVYLYTYEGNKLKYKIPVKTSGADVTFYEYFFRGNNIEKVNGYTFEAR